MKCDIKYLLGFIFIYGGASLNRHLRERKENYIDFSGCRRNEILHNLHLKTYFKNHL